MALKDSANTDRLRFARNLVTALEHGDEAAEIDAVRAILGLHEKRLHRNLSRIAADLREALSASQYPGEVRRLAEAELPDAQERLNRVIELTETAANTSLGAVETALPLIKGIRGSIDGLAGVGREAPAPALLEQLATDAAAIEQCLADVLMAQGFQDITGQIIRRIVRLVAELEAHLSAAGLPAGDDEDGSERPEDSGSLRFRGTGPALAGIDEGALEHQQDVDDLLGQLGL